jgi:antitoxin CcdA
MPAASDRKSTNLTLDKALIAEARELGINVSRAAEKGLAAEVKAERDRRWRDENAEAIRLENAYIEEHGLPLAKYRSF